MKTQVINNEKFKDKNMFKIFEEYESGKLSEKPLISIGIKKAKLLLKHLKELKKYVEENEG